MAYLSDIEVSPFPCHPLVTKETHDKVNVFSVTCFMTTHRHTEGNECHIFFANDSINRAADCGGEGVRGGQAPAFQTKGSKTSGSAIYIYTSRCERSVLKSVRNVAFCDC